jgi:hypothetical protein
MFLHDPRAAGATPPCSRVAPSRAMIENERNRADDQMTPPEARSTRGDGATSFASPGEGAV